MGETVMVEAVARAMLARIRGLGVFAPWAIDGDDEHALPEDGTLQVLVDGRFDMMEVARAAIDAIRNHSFGDTIVLVNGTDPVATLKGDLPGTILRALIDLAMAEDPALASPEEGRTP